MAYPLSSPINISAPGNIDVMLTNTVSVGSIIWNIETNVSDNLLFSTNHVASSSVLELFPDSVSAPNGSAQTPQLNLIANSNTVNLQADPTLSAIYNYNFPAAGPTGNNQGIITSGATNIFSPLVTGLRANGGTTESGGINFVNGTNVTIVDSPAGTFTFNVATGAGGVTTFQTSLSGLTPFTATSGAITLAGTLGVGSGGTGVTTTPTNGQLLIGNGTNYTVATLASGSGISTTTGAGTLQINNTGVLSINSNGGTAETGALSLVNGTNVTIVDSPAGTFTFAVDLFPYTTTVTAAGTTTLTESSTYLQYFTGTTTQTVVLPVTSTLTLGQEFSIKNNSTGLVTVTSSGGNVVSILQPNTTNIVTCTSLTGTTAASWDGGNVGTFAVGANPQGICFDGTNIWVTNYGAASVTALSALTGAVIGTYTVGNNPYQVCFDGTNIWVSNFGSNTVTKLLAATGAIIGTYTVGGNPLGLCFDGTYMWVANYGGNSVTKLLAATGAVIGTYTLGGFAYGICFDGTYIWVTIRDVAGHVFKILPSTGATVSTLFSGGQDPDGICFDGTNIWVANYNGNNITKFSASTGAVIGTYPAGNEAYSLCFDGTNIWVTNRGDTTVTKFLAATGANLGTYLVGPNPYSICFDGANIWVANYGSNNVMKLTQPNAQPGIQSSIIGVPLLSTYDNVLRDTNSNTYINNVIQGYATNTTAAVIDYLSVLSSYNQFFTGTTTQTVVLPNAATTAIGQQFSLTNNSTGLVSIIGANVGATVPAGETSIVTCISNGSTVYFTGTASQSTTSIFGTSTNWTSSMVGGYIVYANANIAPITAFVSATSLTTTTSQTEANQAYVIYYGTSYSTGTVGQSTTTVTGSGTTFTAGMVGGWIVYTSGASSGSTAQIMAFVSPTSLSVTPSRTVTAGTTYAIYYLATPSWSVPSYSSVSTSLPALNYPNNYYASLAGVPIGGLYRSNFNSSITPVTSGVSIVFGTPATTVTMTVTGTPLVVGTLLTGSANIQQGTYILSQVSGTTGGTGVYNVTTPIVANTAAATVTGAGYILSSNPDILYVRTV